LQTIAFKMKVTGQKSYRCTSASERCAASGLEMLRSMDLAGTV
jgi:hypothetical protein